MRDETNSEARTEQETLRPSPHVVAQRVGDEIVLVHLPTNKIYSLSPTGARFWELLAGGSTREEIEASLRAEFAVDDVALKAEIDRITSDLARADLIGGRDVG